MLSLLAITLTRGTSSSRPRSIHRDSTQHDLKVHLRPQAEGIRFGLNAQGVELPAEGLIHVRALSDDFYRYDAATHTLAGHRAGNSFRLGDVIRVEVAHVDIDRRELDFRLVKRLEQAPRADSGKREKKGKERPSRGKNAERKRAEKGQEKPKPKKKKH